MGLRSPKTTFAKNFTKKRHLDVCIVLEQWETDMQGLKDRESR